MPSAWSIALKQYNEDKPGWCIPKKGTPQHAEILELARAYSGKGEVPSLPEGSMKPKALPKALKKKVVAEVVELKPIGTGMENYEKKLDVIEKKYRKRGMGVEGYTDKLGSKIAKMVKKSKDKVQ